MSTCHQPYPEHYAYYFTLQRISCKWPLQTPHKVFEFAHWMGCTDRKKKVLDKKKLAVEEYVNSLAEGTIPLDQLWLLFVARNWHIGISVILKSGIWTTRRDNSLEGMSIFFIVCRWYHILWYYLSRVHHPHSPIGKSWFWTIRFQRKLSFELNFTWQCWQCWYLIGWGLVVVSRIMCKVIQESPQQRLGCLFTNCTNHQVKT